VDRLDRQLAMLQGISEHAGEHLMRGIGLGRVQVTDGGALLSFVGAEHAKVCSRRRAIAVQRRELSAEIEVLQHELDRVRGAQQRERYAAAVSVEVLEGGEFTLDLEYTVRGGASWRPMYDLRLIENETGPEVELTYLGQVSQSTGEEWSEIALTLSTARPSVSAQLPELSPWYIDLYQERRKRAAPPQPPSLASFDRENRRARMDMAESAELEEAALPEPIEASVMEANVDASGAAVTFAIPRRLDIPADNTPHKATIAILDMTPQLDYMAVPKQSNEVFRRARIVNASEFLLLPGPVNLFHGSEFVGRSALPKVAPQQEFETTMGIDDRIRVDRELVVQKVSKQFIGDRRVRQYAYEIEVENLLSHTAQVVVKDQLPVAANEDIRVKVETIDPPCTEQSEQGELTWRLSLKPGAKQKVRFEFTITAPRSEQLTGLPLE
jgi:uncharacterized protein (TIGR02231 family)